MRARKVVPRNISWTIALFARTSEQSPNAHRPLVEEAREPTGVRIQYPDKAGWDRAAMVRFLLSVHVGAGVEASLS